MPKRSTGSFADHLSDLLFCPTVLARVQAAGEIQKAGPWTAAYGDGYAGAAILRALEEDR